MRRHPQRLVRQTRVFLLPRAYVSLFLVIRPLLTKLTLGVSVCNGPERCIFVRVVDTCAGCKTDSQHVDLTKAAFRALAPLDDGVLNVQMRKATPPKKWFVFFISSIKRTDKADTCGVGVRIGGVLKRCRMHADCLCSENMPITLRIPSSLMAYILVYYL